MRYFLLAFFCLPGFSSASSIQSWIDQAASSHLAEQPTWLKLLHYETDGSSDTGYRSAVKSESFFNSPVGSTNARAELIATLEAFNTSLGEDSNAHPQCLFRARYFWLREQLGFADTDFPIVSCPLYDRWTLGGKTESISIVFATGYLGNPASYYGHTLLKFNGSGVNRTSDLLDVSVNYGAIIPDSVNPVSYIVNGIFGGYDGGFSHIEFYYHNHNYAELELRDIWEYELDLTPFQVALITAHSWELLGKNFTYYFFRRNCAYRMAKVLQIVDGIDLIPKRRGWTIPQALVQNVAQSTVDGKPLLSDVRYYPSRQSRFYERFSELSPEERRLSRDAIEDIGTLYDIEFSSLSGASRARILDALIDYYQYLLKPNLGPEHEIPVRYNKLLALRFEAPATNGNGVIELPSAPHEGRDPSVFRAGPAHSSVYGDGVTLQLRPAYYDVLDADAGHVADSALTMFDLSVSVYDNSAILRRLDFFNVKSVNGGVTGFPEDDGAAWWLRLGLSQQNLGCDDCLVGRFSGAYGKTLRLGDRVLFGALLGGALQNNQERSGAVYASVTGLAHMELTSKMRVRVSYEQRRHLGGGLRSEDVVDVGLRYSLDRHWEIRLSYQKNVAEESMLAVGYYW